MIQSNYTEITPSEKIKQFGECQCCNKRIHKNILLYENWNQKYICIPCAEELTDEKIIELFTLDMEEDADQKIFLDIKKHFGLC